MKKSNGYQIESKIIWMLKMWLASFCQHYLANYDLKGRCWHQFHYYIQLIKHLSNSSLTLWKLPEAIKQQLLNINARLSPWNLVRMWTGFPYSVEFVLFIPVFARYFPQPCTPTTCTEAPLQHGQRHVMWRLHGQNGAEGGPFSSPICTQSEAKQRSGNSVQFPEAICSAYVPPAYVQVRCSLCKAERRGWKLMDTSLPSWMGIAEWSLIIAWIETGTCDIQRNLLLFNVLKMLNYQAQCHVIFSLSLSFSFVKGILLTSLV